MSQGDRLVTFAELEQATEHLTGVLHGHGVGRGGRVAWWGETSIDAIPLWFATARLGAALVPVNPRTTPPERASLLDLADPCLVVGDEVHPGEVTLAALSAESSPGRAVNSVDERATHAIFFTSGTSGRPKGVELSHRASRLRVMTDATLSPNGPVVCMSPPFHMAGWFGPMTAWANADEAVFVDRADAASLLTVVHRRRATRLYAIPSIWRRILSSDRQEFTSVASGSVTRGRHPPLPSSCKRSPQRSPDHVPPSRTDRPRPGESAACGPRTSSGSRVRWDCPVPAARYVWTRRLASSRSATRF